MGLIAYFLYPVSELLWAVPVAGFRYFIDLDVSDANADTGSLIQLRWILYVAMVKVGYLLWLLGIYAPFRGLMTFIYSVAQQDHVRFWYELVIAIGLSSLRVAFAAVFIGSWILLPPLKWASSILLLRLAESNRGALTALGAGMALLAKLVQEYLK